MFLLKNDKKLLNIQIKKKKKNPRRKNTKLIFNVECLSIIRRLVFEKFFKNRKLFSKFCLLLIIRLSITAFHFYRFHKWICTFHLFFLRIFLCMAIKKWREGDSTTDLFRNFLILTCKWPRRLSVWCFCCLGLRCHGRFERRRRQDCPDNKKPYIRSRAFRLPEPSGPRVDRLLENLIKSEISNDLVENKRNQGSLSFALFLILDKV